MLRIIEGKGEIAECQRRLEIAMRAAMPQVEYRNIGFPSSTVRNAKVASDGQHWFHTRDLHEGTPRRLNWFGQFKAKGDLNITVEINTPYSGRRDRVSGYFVRDTGTGQTFIAHSGRVGGGTAGVGKEGFLAWTDQRLVRAEDSDGKLKLGILVAPLDDRAGTVNAILRYVESIAQYKAAARAGETTTAAFRRKVQEYRDFYGEGRGQRRGTRAAEIAYVTRHGEIVDALNSWREAKPKPRNARIVKNVYIDLGVKVGQELVEVYEAKPSSDRSSVYTAMGQLLVHGRAIGCRHIMVLPEGDRLAADLVDALGRLKIEVLHFRFAKKGAIIVEQKG